MNILSHSHCVFMKKLNIFVIAMVFVTGCGSSPSKRAIELPEWFHELPLQGEFLGIGTAIMSNSEYQQNATDGFEE